MQVNFDKARLETALTATTNGWVSNMTLRLRDTIIASQGSLAFQILGLTLKNQSQMLAFTNTFEFIMWCLIMMLPLAFLIKKTE